MEKEYRKIKLGPLSTSDRELKDLLKAWLIISIAFGLVLRKNFTSTWMSFVIAAIAVGSGFLLHELAHKVVAQRYHYFAEFRAFDEMLFLALMMSLFGVVFVAPGAVMIFTESIQRNKNGKISAAGPAMNFILAGLFFLVAITTTGFLKIVGQYGFQVNAWLGLFNLIPVWNFDGAKIWRWNKIVWSGMVIIGLLFVFII